MSWDFIKKSILGFDQFKLKFWDLSPPPLATPIKRLQYSSGIQCLRSGGTPLFDGNVYVTLKGGLFKNISLRVVLRHFPYLRVKKSKFLP